MTDTLLLVGRAHVSAVAQRHAARLRERGVADAVAVATYDEDPAELAPAVEGTPYVVPLAAAPGRDTMQSIPGALPAARHCAPVGTNPAVTRALADRAREVLSPGADASVALVAFGDASGTDARQTTEAHAERLRSTTAYGEVRTAYLLQNPAAECVRYNLTGERGVAVPFFVAACEETDRALPAKLDLDRGGLAYADPLGDHNAVTDAIEAEFERARAAGSSTAAVSPVATDGRGP